MNNWVTSELQEYDYTYDEICEAQRIITYLSECFKDKSGRVSK